MEHAMAEETTNALRASWIKTSLHK